MPEEDEKEAIVGGIKSTNEFKRPKRERKKKTDVERIEEIRAELDKEVPSVSQHPVSQQEAELDLQQMGEETAHVPPKEPAKPSPEHHITYKKSSGAYLSVQLAMELLNRVRLQQGKLIVRGVEFLPSEPDEVVVKLRLTPEKQE